MPRTWPWAAASALLLAGTMGLYASTGSLIDRAGLPATAEHDARAVAALSELLGGDAAARELATLVIAEEQIQLAREPLDLGVPEDLSERP